MTALYQSGQDASLDQNNPYWTSSEISDANVYIIFFDDGYIDNRGKKTTARVIAIREF